MAVKHITDAQVCQAVQDCKTRLETVELMYQTKPFLWPYQLLAQRTGQCEKVCFCAMERAANLGLIECGVSLRSGWLTEKGKAILTKER